jgi:hypothetical protein
MPLMRMLHAVAYPLAVLMLAAWALVIFAGPGWGWMHLFLTFGVVLLIWRIVQPNPPKTK